MQSTSITYHRKSNVVRIMHLRIHVKLMFILITMLTNEICKVNRYADRKEMEII